MWMLKEQFELEMAKRDLAAQATQNAQRLAHDTTKATMQSTIDTLTTQKALEIATVTAQLKLVSDTNDAQLKLERAAHAAELVLKVREAQAELQISKDDTIMSLTEELKTKDGVIAGRDGVIAGKDGVIEAMTKVNNNLVVQVSALQYTVMEMAKKGPVVIDPKIITVEKQTATAAQVFIDGKPAIEVVK